MTAAGAPPLHIEETGAGAPVVLLHSSGLSGRQWRRLVPLLVARGLRAVSVDLTGHGASASWPEPQPFSFETDVDRVAAHLRSLAERGEQAHVVGHSYGAFVGLRAALEAPAAVRSMVLFEPVAFGTLDPVADADARAELSSVEVRWGEGAEAHERWLQAFVDYWGGAGAWAALRDEMRAEFRRVGWVVQEGVRTLMGDRTPAAAYAKLGMPVRVLTGELSPVAARRVARRLGEVVPGGEVVTIGGVGHMAPLAQADVVNGRIVEGIR